MTDPVEEWFAYLQQRGRSPATLATYRSVMRHYPADPISVTLEQAEQWWASKNDLAVKTRQRTLSCVRSFYRYAVRFDLLDLDPTRRLDPPSQGRRLPRPIARGDMLKVLSVAPPDLYRAVCLGGYGGLRVAEVAALDWANIDIESRRIRVLGKGDKERPVGLSPLLLDAIMPNTGGNVVTAGGVPYTAGRLQRKINRLIASEGIAGTFHSLRSRYATVALASTGNLLAVSRALGHQNTSTTAIYALTSDTDLDLIAEAVTR